MALSNAERQKRHRERLKARAKREEGTWETAVRTTITNDTFFQTWPSAEDALRYLAGLPAIDDLQLISIRKVDEEASLRNGTTS